jgi:hypothetical protein
MKNQYYGDINDYKKYSLIRHLVSNGKIETAICWVLTENDDLNDGKKTKYLEQPEIWQKYDPIVFNLLRETVLENGNRNVQNVENGDIIPNCRFYNKLMVDDINRRESFFSQLYKFADGVDLIFFDPDNGMEVKSVPYGKKKSSKYIYWNEIETAFELGYSILLYQHFPRKPREPFIHNLVKHFRDLENIQKIITYCTHHVAFILVPQPQHEKLFSKSNRKISHDWGNLIKIKEHHIAIGDI